MFCLRKQLACGSHSLTRGTEEGILMVTVRETEPLSSKSYGS